jgi:hypothetical protein
MALWRLEKISLADGYAAARDDASRLSATWPYTQQEDIYTDLQRWLSGQALMIDRISETFASDRPQLGGTLLALRQAESSHFGRRAERFTIQATAASAVLSDPMQKCRAFEREPPDRTAPTSQNTVVLHDCLLLRMAVCKLGPNEAARFLSSASLLEGWQSGSINSKDLVARSRQINLPISLADPGWIECEVSARGSLRVRGTPAITAGKKDVFDALSQPAAAPGEAERRAPPAESSGVGKVNRGTCSSPRRTEG